MILVHWFELKERCSHEGRNKAASSRGGDNVRREREVEGERRIKGRRCFQAGP